MGGWRPGFMV